MRISTVGYTMKQGVKNIGRNKLFSLASVATMAACIFLFGQKQRVAMGRAIVRHPKVLRSKYYDRSAAAVPLT